MSIKRFSLLLSGENGQKVKLKEPGRIMSALNLKENFGFNSLWTNAGPSLNLAF